MQREEKTLIALVAIAAAVAAETETGQSWH
jgi:hypothetical protein